MNAQKIKDAYIIANKIFRIDELHKEKARNVSTKLTTLQSLAKFSAFTEVVEAGTNSQCMTAYCMLEDMCIAHNVPCKELLICDWLNASLCKPA